MPEEKIFTGPTNKMSSKPMYSDVTIKKFMYSLKWRGEIQKKEKQALFINYQYNEELNDFSLLLNIFPSTHRHTAA